MYHDDKVYENSMALTCAWNEKLRDVIPGIIAEVADHAGVEAEAEFVGMGAFNIVYKVEKFGGIYRFPIFGKSAFRYEKTNDECMIMQYLSRFTAIVGQSSNSVRKLRHSIGSGNGAEAPTAGRRQGER